MFFDRAVSEMQGSSMREGGRTGSGESVACVRMGPSGWHAAVVTCGARLVVTVCAGFLRLRVLAPNCAGAAGGGMAAAWLMSAGLAVAGVGMLNLPNFA